MNGTATARVATEGQEQEGVKARYLECLNLVERLHRQLTAGELRTRGHYLGSNVSYNLKKLVEGGYINHVRSESDRRSVRVSLTDKGREICKIVAGLFDRHVHLVEPAGGLQVSEFAHLNKSLQRLERFWMDQVRYRL